MKPVTVAEEKKKKRRITFLVGKDHIEQLDKIKRILNLTSDATAIRMALTIASREMNKNEFSIVP